MNLKKDINFSLWCDFVERDFLKNEFKSLVDDGVVCGATSNPAIFEQAITNSAAYKQQIDMLQANKPKKIYEELAIADIKNAASILKPLYENNSDDGFISIEVDPTLCNDAMSTIQEGSRLHSLIGYENVMIKVPATKAGYIAIRELVGMGISVNATLVFSPAQAYECAKAFNEGISKTNKNIKGVISVFVSRFDRMCDTQMTKQNLPTAKLGIINATKCYYEVNKFDNANIRVLFASTGVKGDILPPSYYIDNLIIPNTINTAPLNTIKEWLKNGSKVECDISSEAKCDKYFSNLEQNGININNIYTKLLKDGLESFRTSFDEILKSVNQK